jgi:hypothetical protein
MPGKTVCVVARRAAVPSFVGSMRDADNRELRKKRPRTEVEQRAGKGWHHKLKFMGDCSARQWISRWKRVSSQTVIEKASLSRATIHRHPYAATNIGSEVAVVALMRPNRTSSISP